jgi:biopolymer transport protein ExbD
LKIELGPDDYSEVDMSPIIDFVFLLLIFFLVASLLKKWEMQIPIKMPDITSSLDATTEEDKFLLGMDKGGLIYRQDGKTQSGFPLFAPVTVSDAFFSTLKPDQPIRILAERDTPFQQVIDVLDQCQLAGFERTELKLLSGQVRKQREGDRQ